MFGLGQMDPALRQRWMMGLGARLMQPSRYGASGVFSDAMLGSMGDLARLTQEARRETAMSRQEELQKQQQERFQRQMEEDARMRMERDKLLASIQSGTEKSLGQGQQMVPGDAYMPGTAGIDVPVDRAGLGRRAQMFGAAHGQPAMTSLGNQMASPPPMRKMPGLGGSIDYQQWGRDGWQTERTAKGPGLARSSVPGGVYEEFNPEGTKRRSYRFGPKGEKIPTTEWSIIPSTASDTTALQRNVPFLARVMDIPESDAAGILTQVKGKSPDETRRKLYEKALTVSYGDVARARRITDESMKFLFQKDESDMDPLEMFK